MSTISSVDQTHVAGAPPTPLSWLRHNPLFDLVLLVFRPGAVPEFSPTRAWIKRHPLLSLFGLAYAFTWIGAIGFLANPAAASQRSLNVFSFLYAFFFLAGCLWAAVIVANATTGRRALFSRLLRWRVNIIWYLVALFFPAFITLAGVALNVALGGTMPQMPITAVPVGSWALVVAINLGVYMIGNFEEFTWRGVGLPRLQAKHSALTAALILGVVQAAWHLPYFFVPNSLEQQIGPFPFLAWNIGLSIVITWVYNNARGSLLIVILFHAANNAWGGLLTAPGDTHPIFLSIGVLYVVAIVLVVVFGARRLSRKPSAEIALATEAD